MASRPSDTKTIVQAVEAIDNEELALEAAATASFFELISKLVDATDRPEMTRFEFQFFRTIFIVIGCIYHTFWWFHQQLLHFLRCVSKHDEKKRMY